MPGINRLLSHSKAADSWLNNDLDIDIWRDLANSATKPLENWNAFNAFYDKDLEDSGQENKTQFLRFMLRLAKTRASTLPNWNEEDECLVNPNKWELLWLVTYEIFGPVADADKALEEATAKRRSNPTEFTQEQTAQLLTLGRGKSSRIHTTPRRKTDLNRKTTSFLLVTCEPTRSFTTDAQGVVVLQEFVHNFMGTMSAVSPEALLVPDPHRSENRQMGTISVQGPEEVWPATKWTVPAYMKGMFFPRAGRSGEFIICVKHDSPLQAMLDRLNEYNNSLHFKEHCHKTWDVTKCTWLGGSYAHCNRDTLTEAIHQAPQFKQLLKTHPNAKIYLVWDTIRNSPTQAVDWKKRIQAMHVVAETSVAKKVDNVLHLIYNTTKKKNFPLDRKFTPYTNGGERHMSVGKKERKTLWLARGRQRNFNRNVKFMKLDVDISHFGY